LWVSSVSPDNSQDSVSKRSKPSAFITYSPSSHLIRSSRNSVVK
jgi:hypothetical protein